MGDRQEVTKVMARAFKRAWTEIAGQCGNDPQLIAATRMKLAEAVLAAVSEYPTDVEALKNAALKILARDFRPMR